MNIRRMDPRVTREISQGAEYFGSQRKDAPGRLVEDLLYASPQIESPCELT